MNREEADDESRNRWYEYYRGIGWTTDMLIEAGLTKQLEKIIEKPAVKVNVTNIKNQLKYTERFKPKKIDPIKKAGT